MLEFSVFPSLSSLFHFVLNSNRDFYEVLSLRFYCFTCFARCSLLLAIAIVSLRVAKVSWLPDFFQGEDKTNLSRKS